MELRHRIGHRLILVPSISDKPVVIIGVCLGRYSTEIHAQIIIPTIDGSMFFDPPMLVPLDLVLKALDKEQSEKE